jgi:hypothetical protein
MTGRVSKTWWVNVNLRRGLFRTWVILAVIWVVTCGIFAFVQRGALFPHSTISSISNADPSLISQFNSVATPLPGTETAPPPPANIDVLAYEFAAGVVIMPPLLLLIFGASVLWAVSGFAGEKPLGRGRTEKS